MPAQRDGVGTRAATRRAPTSPRKRAPQRCRKCPDKPLRSTCMHAWGRKSLVVQEETSPAQPQEISPPSLAPASVPQVDLAAEQALPITPTTSVTLVLASPEEEAAELQEVAVAAIPATAGDGEPNPNRDGPGDEEPNPNRGSNASPRAYPSNANPIYGFVTGFGRGNEEAKLARVRPRKDVIRDRSRAMKTYDVLTRDLICRAESIANATGSWIYIAINNPNARTPFQHFTSRKLRREAAEPMQELHGLVSRMMADLKRADRANLLELVRSEAAANAQAASALGRAEAAEERVSRLEGELDARNQIIASLVTSATRGVGHMA